MKKNVAIASVHLKMNYGSMLQSMALQKALNKLNIENEIIDMTLLSKDIAKKRTAFYLTQIFSPSFIKAKYGKIKFELLKKIVMAEQMDGIKKREQRFNDFKKGFILSKQYKSIEELSESCGIYTDVIVGSDQLWLPINIAGDYYTLSFAPETMNKISYGTSFGVSNIPERYKERYRHFLNRINHLSVREESGKNIISELTGRGAEIVCDPTLLFDKAGWSEIIPTKEIIDQKYIFCYFLGGNIRHRQFAEKLKNISKLPIVSLIHMEEYYKHDNSFADYTPFDIGPFEFVNLIRGAEYVCTDSYHGTIFSMIHDKNFFTFKRFSDDSAMSTNTRINSLLNSADVRGRYLDGTEDAETQIKNVINYNNVEKKFSEIRAQSFTFLLNALDIKKAGLT